MNKGGKIITIGFTLIVIALLQGIEGVYFAAFIALLYVIPGWIFLRTYLDDTLESVMYGALASMAIALPLIYLFSFLIGSIRLTAGIIWLIAMLIAFFMKKKNLSEVAMDHTQKNKVQENKISGQNGI